jgi:aerobic carbon-monoxide dehydrogenase small subunit
LGAVAATLVNGAPADPPETDRRLLDWLRADRGITSVKEGCGAGHCGACTVLRDGRPVLSCCVYTAQVVGAEIVTAEGVAGTVLGRRLVDELVARGAMQCGYCTPGMVVAAFAALSGRAGVLVEAEARAALTGNVCRCTGYAPIVEAMLAVSGG